MVMGKIEAKKSAFIVLSNEERIELHRIQWTTYKNLKDWFLAFKKIIVEYGFATLVQYSMFSFPFFYLPLDSITFDLFICLFFKHEGDEGEEAYFSVSQKWRILNMDEANFSLDGSDGGYVASILMCGSNTAGEALPIHIMFSSKAEDEKNYSVIIEWCFSLPRVFAQFGHFSLQSFPASVTVNPKGGTDSRVLAQLLMSYVE
jgi:hypothetical protein